MTRGGTDVMAAVKDLAQRLPAGATSVARADRLAASTDLWPRHLIRLNAGESPELPAAVVWPQSVEDLLVIVKRARASGLTLVPYGAGSSVVGGATTSGEQVVVDLKRMDRVLAIDGEERTATAEAGIIGELLERQLNRAGYTQGHFPSSIYCSSLGGWIAARSAGQMSSRYGKIEDQVVGGRIVLGDGSLVTQPTNPVHAGLLDQLIGSEGTLGIWAEATVRIHPLPETRVFRGFSFPNLERSLAAAQAWLYAGLTPSVLRIYDPLDTFLHRTTHTHERRDRGANRLAWAAAHFPQVVTFLADRVAASCRCILGFEGAEDLSRAEMKMAIEIARRFAAEDLGPEAGEAWYATRYAISYKQSNAFRAGVAVDTMEVACPWEKVQPVYDAVRSAVLHSDAQVLAHFSHVYLAGCSIYFTYALPLTAGVDGYRRLWRNALAAAVAAGANVSHHHGAGRHKAEAVAESLGGATQTVVAMRRRLDPDRIMNPGVLVDEPSVGAKDKPLAPAPPEDGFVAVAQPNETLAAIEERLRGLGRSLGASAVLFGDVDCLAAARRGLAWRVNPQLRIIEPVVWGVDATVDGAPHRFIPAPRSAIGPDLVRALLDETVERLWLRCQTRLPLRRRFRADLDEALQAAADLVGNPLAWSLEVSLAHAPGGGGLLELALPDDARTPLIAGEIDRRMAYGCEEIPADGPLWANAMEAGPTPFFFAGSWRAVDAFVEAIELDRCGVVIPWTDPVGAAGFIHGGDGGRLAELAADHQVRIDCTIEKPQASRRAAKKREPVVGPPGEPLATPLRLGDDVGALENCTYCPKLCRFSCAVAVADGSETLTPRQLMLTANLDRTSRRALDPDTAARLWACVDCGGCASFCDHGNDVAGTLQRARAELWSRGVAPAAVRAYLTTLRVAGWPADRPAKDDAAALIAAEADGEAAQTALFLGCQSGAEEATAAARTLALCRRRLGPTRVLRGRCCGQPLWRWGDREGFAANARAFASQLRGVVHLVVDDPGCAATLRELYPDIGIELPEVTTTSELIGESGLTELPDGPWTIHHPCHAGGAAAEAWLGQALRRRAGDDRVAGSVVEGEAGSCGGMLVESFDPVLAQRLREHAAADLLGGGAERVLASSPSCRRQLRAAGVEVIAPIELWRG